MFIVIHLLAYLALVARYYNAESPAKRLAGLCAVLTWPAQCLRDVEDTSRLEQLHGEAGGLSATVYRLVGVVPSQLVHFDFLFRRHVVCRHGSLFTNHRLLILYLDNVSTQALMQPL